MATSKCLAGSPRHGAGSSAFREGEVCVCVHVRNLRRDWDLCVRWVGLQPGCGPVPSLAERSCVRRHRCHRSCHCSHLAAATFSQQPLPWQLADLSLQACKED
ncbi:hypothetical protein EXN66_Car003838 [Channa argus]|uniref:Uncharacterized protein n=1 Tax=Channa argus TaxID=215402 RepID=A0A6G1PDR0_CHAAH|nr:hypothetical protein EXN66_Car003838 [Channa argus]